MSKSNIQSLFAVSLVAFVTACGGGGEGGSPSANVPAPGAVFPGPDTLAPVTLTDTKTLEVANDFAFDTARVIDIDFDLDSARNTHASVSICTRFEEDGGAFDVDYDSCAIRAPMTDGVFSHQMEITNEFDSVVAVVWFNDDTLDPMHRVFGIDPPVAVTTDRGVRAAPDQRRVIVWK